MAGGITQDTLDSIEKKIALHPDFPRKGVLFRDLLPVYREPHLIDAVITALTLEAERCQAEVVLGLEARGLTLAFGVAQRLKLPMIFVRKQGKVPGKCHSVDYDLEYGKDTLVIQEDSIPQNSKCFIVDDLIATGGTMEASKKLVMASSAQVVGTAVVIELVALNGRQRLEDTSLFSLFKY